MFTQTDDALVTFGMVLPTQAGLFLPWRPRVVQRSQTVSQGERQEKASL